MNGDPILARLTELRAVFDKDGLSDEAVEEVFHLVETLSAERDALRAFLYRTVDELIAERARSIVQDRR